ncbi:hypothetical protein RUM43_004770, partial [Polyplax serrata]
MSKGKNTEQIANQWQWIRKIPEQSKNVVRSKKTEVEIGGNGIELCATFQSGRNKR